MHVRHHWQAPATAGTYRQTRTRSTLNFAAGHQFQVAGALSCEGRIAVPRRGDVPRKYRHTPKAAPARSLGDRPAPFPARISGESMARDQIPARNCRTPRLGSFNAPRAGWPNSLPCHIPWPQRRPSCPQTSVSYTHPVTRWRIPHSLLNRISDVICIFAN